MNTTNIIIIGGVVLLGLIIYWKFFRPSKIKEKRIKQKAKETKQQLLLELLNKYVTKTLLFENSSKRFLNQDGQVISELENCILYKEYDRESVVPKFLPVFIANIRLSDDSENRYIIYYGVKKEQYEFMVKYVGDDYIIVNNLQFGELALPRKNINYHINQKIALRFNVKDVSHFYTSADIKEYYLNVSPEIIE